MKLYGRLLGIVIALSVFGLFMTQASWRGSAQESQREQALQAGAKATPPSGEIETIPVEEIRPGMKGYGLSVFRGTTIEKFDIEVISVIERAIGDQDIILVMVDHKVTDHAMVIHGMSGSPIYIEGRLAGALSRKFSGLPKDPIAGVTPIKAMLADRDHPWEEEEAFIPMPDAASPYRYCGAPLMVSGAPLGAFKDLKTFFEPLGFTVLAGAGGQTKVAQDVKLEPGAAVGISLLRGDIEMDGVGTVTYVNGNDVLVFGHPMFMGGQLELPMTTAYVHTIIADQQASYKLSSIINSVGTVRKDRMASVYGVLGEPPAMIPLTVEVRNPASGFQKNYSFEVARHSYYTPYLVSAVPGYCIQLAESGEMKDATVDYQVSLKFEGHPAIELKDAYVDSMFGGGGGSYQQTLMQLMGNAFKKVRLERADVKLSLVHRRNIATIDAAWADTPTVKPGEKLKIAVRLRPYNKEAVTETFEIALPRTIPGGTYQITLMGGQEASGSANMMQMIQMLMGGGGMSRSGAQSFEEMLDEIRKRHRSSEVVAHFELPSVGMRYKDREMQKLPGSVFATLASNASAGMRVAADELRVTRSTPWVIEGRRVVNFEVEIPGQAPVEEN